MFSLICEKKNTEIQRNWSFVGEISSIKGISWASNIQLTNCVWEQDVEETKNTLIHVANIFSS